MDGKEAAIEIDVDLTKRESVSASESSRRPTDHRAQRFAGGADELLLLVRLEEPDPPWRLAQLPHARRGVVALMMPDQESSKVRRAQRARSWEGMEHPTKPRAARRSWPR